MKYLYLIFATLFFIGCGSTEFEEVIPNNNEPSEQIVDGIVVKVAPFLNEEEQTRTSLTLGTTSSGSQGLKFSWEKDTLVYFLNLLINR